MVWTRTENSSSTCLVQMLIKWLVYGLTGHTQGSVRLSGLSTSHVTHVSASIWCSPNASLRTVTLIQKTERTIKGQVNHATGATPRVVTVLESTFMQCISGHTVWEHHQQHTGNYHSTKHGLFNVIEKIWDWIPACKTSTIKHYFSKNIILYIFIF